MLCVFFFQAEDGIRDLVRSRGLGDVYKRQVVMTGGRARFTVAHDASRPFRVVAGGSEIVALGTCLLYTSDAAHARSSVDLGGRPIIKKKNNNVLSSRTVHAESNTILTMHSRDT